MFKTIGSYVLAGAVALCGADAAYAQQQSPAFRVGQTKAPQTLNFTFGAFVPRGADGRVEGDVLTFNQTFLTFDIGDFTGVTFCGEYLLPIGRWVELGAGVSFTQRTAPSVYTDFIANDGSEIQQDLKLRRVPIEFTGRLMPLGPASKVQPYVGGGLAIIAWRYTETGEFVDFDQGGTIFRDEFTDSGSAVGPVFLGGVRYATDAFSVGFEIRYQKADGDLDPVNFVPPKIDLGGWNYQATFGLRFD